MQLNLGTGHKLSIAVGITGAFASAIPLWLGAVSDAANCISAHWPNGYAGAAIPAVIAMIASSLGPIFSIFTPKGTVTLPPVK